MSFGSGGTSKEKAWRDIWGAGQSVAQIGEILPAGQVVDKLRREYLDAKARLDAIAAPYGASAARPAAE